MQNEIMKKLSNTLRKDMLSSINGTVSGFVTSVDYENRKANIIYNQKNGGRRIINDISFPTGENGVFATSLDVGDMVELTSRNNSLQTMFISNVYRKEKSYDDVELDKGHKMPKMTSLF